MGVFLTERAAGPDRVVVIGGGLSGLVAAHRLFEMAKARRRSVEIIVLEAKERVGGSIGTRRVNGFILESGADSFITNKSWGVDLCEALGLNHQLIGTDPDHRRSFVVR